MRGVTKSRPADEAAWLELANRCSYATFFHTPHWARIALVGQPGLRDASVALTREDGSTMLWPLLEVRRPRLGVGRVLVSTFAGCYGGPISEAPPSPIDFEQLKGAAGLGPTAQLHVTGNPFAPATAVPREFSSRQEFTHVIDLEAGGDAVEAGFERGPRGWVNRARREGVTVASSTAREDWMAYSEMYAESLEHWGDTATSRHPPAVFEALRALAEREPTLVRLWMASLNGEPLVGTIVLYWRDHAVSWHTARTHKRPHMGSGPLLTAEVAGDARERGVAMLDLNPSGGHEGTFAYKQTLGSRLVPLPVLTWRGTLLSAARAVARRGR
jgi:hypothetical protein